MLLVWLNTVSSAACCSSNLIVAEIAIESFTSIAGSPVIVAYNTQAAR